MTSLPITTNCYQERIAALQSQLNQMLEQTHNDAAIPEFLDLLETQVQPLCAAIWAMHAEVEQDLEPDKSL